MRYLLAVFLALLPLSVIFAASPDDIPLAPAVECSPRAGLPNFFRKLSAGGAVKIGYLGGSITAQEGWRPKSLHYFATTFPNAKLSQINAAIGGTGSDLGVFRVKQDVLDHQPDLMFIEFAVNDGGAPPDQIYRCMEGIIRQTWKTLPECDICFVYTLVQGFAPTLQEGKFPRAASAMEKVADHYGIPSIHMGLQVAQLAKEGKLIFKGKLPKTDAEKSAVDGKIIFSDDGTHPYPETGHELYLQAIARSMPAIQAAGTVVGAHELKSPFVTDNYENAKLIPIDQATMSAGFTKRDPKSDPMAKRFANRPGMLYRADRPGETLTFQFRGRSVAIYDVIGPDCGQIIVTLDDQKPAIRPRFDSYCTYARLSTFSIGSQLGEGLHTVKIEIHPDQPDKAKILSQRKESIDDPKRFDGTAFYPGAILVVGDLVK